MTVEDTGYEIPRQFPRTLFHDTPWVFVLHLKDDELSISPLQLEAQNISLGGMRFLANKKIPIFTKLSLQLLDKTGKKPPLALEGKVIRVDETDIGLAEKTFGMAIQFNPLSPAVLQTMKTVLEAAQK